MQKKSLFSEFGFREDGISKNLVHDSPYFKIINFNFEPGQELPVHSHEVEGQLTILVLEGEGEFLGAEGSSYPAEAGDIVVSEISEPHGIRATTRLRALVTIAPPV